MTFEEFQATKKVIPDLSQITSYDEDKNVPALTYLDVLYISMWTETWKGNPAEPYKYLLLLGRDEWLSNDLSELERRLYEFAKSEGYFDREQKTYNRFKTAIEVQNAGNLRALAREFVKVVDQAAEDTKSTEKTWQDPAVVLFVNKFESLCRSEERFSHAYDMCQKLSA